MKLAIVVPCYNEEEVLTETTTQLSRVLDTLKDGKSVDEGVILYVDDGSKDRTWELVEAFARENPYVAGIKLAHNVGHQQALWAGLEWAATHADASVSIDADLQDDVQAIGFTARRGTTVTSIQADVERVVRQAHLLAPDDGQALHVFNLETLFQMIDNLFRGIETLVWLIGVGTLLSGAIGVSNIMMVTVRERTGEIGIRRAIGARPSSILWQVMAESIVLTVIAGLAGITFAVALLSGVEHIVAAQGETISFQVSFGLALGAAAALAVLGGLAGLAPSMRALSIRPIDAIRDE